jgi:hypothetical protein
MLDAVEPLFLDRRDDGAVLQDNGCRIVVRGARRGVTLEKVPASVPS